ncbi:MarR family winged helix-turn-helix transcriptional regulator [Pseudarthrobacter sp. S9]|uniref:MarR family winged helix-turn-helix transcriptional regulator n=1 Tax=Pseudarthrobacter sp. S9 TaxID=3418421 RepID=UPI003D03583E
MDSPAAPRPKRTAFLLSQLGALASSRFAERTREIGLTPSDAGVLRLIGRAPGLSQRALADRLGAVPSRVVSLIDSLQARGLVERERSSTDRRIYELRLTIEGAQVLGQLREIAEAHEAELLAPLTDEQSAQLGSLLAQLAGANALDLDLHRDSGARIPLR